MKFIVVAHKKEESEEGGYWAEVPALPDCLTEGSSLNEVRDNAKDCIVGWLDSMNEPFILSPSPEDVVIEIEV